MPEMYKVICIGSAFVGKTSLARRYTMNTFTHSYIPTLGVSWLTKEEILSESYLNQNLTKKLFNEPVQVRLSIWDTGAQEIFTYLRPRYYEGTSSAIVVYDITNPASFDELDFWVNEVVAKCADVPIVLCGNKFDLKDARAVSKEDAIKYAKIHKFDYLETSALSSFNVDALFQHAARLAVQYNNEFLKYKKSYIL